MVNLIKYNNKRVEVPPHLVRNIKEPTHYAEDVEKILITNRKKDVHHVDFPMPKWDVVCIYYLIKKDDGWGEKVR